MGTPTGMRLAQVDGLLQGLSGLVSVSAADRDQVVRQTGRELLLAQDRFADLTDASAGKRYLDGLIEQVRAAPTIRG